MWLLTDGRQLGQAEKAAAMTACEPGRCAADWQAGSVTLW